MPALSTPVSRSPSPVSFSGQPAANVREGAPVSLVRPAAEDAFEATMARATALLNEDRPQEALAILAPHAHGAQARTSYVFQSRLGTAHMGAADALAHANLLGACAIVPDASGRWTHAAVQAEKMSCYVGVLGAYGQMLTLLRQPDIRAHFIEKNGAETLDVVEAGAAAGIDHATLECQLLLTKIYQVNANKASQAFLMHALGTGRLRADDALVRSFFEVASDPLFEQIAAATENLFAAAQNQEQPAQLFFMAWLEQQKQAFAQRDEVKLVNALANR